MLLAAVSKERRPRHELDTYLTPLEFCEAGLSLVTGTPRLILDPGSGEGAWGIAARKRWPQAHLTGVEIQEKFQKPVAYDTWISTDFRKWLHDDEPRPLFDLVIGNPPYKDGEWESWLIKCMSLLSFGGEVIWLLPHRYLEGKERACGLFEQFPPVRVAYAGRPQFYGEGTGAEPFDYYHWRAGWKGDTVFDWMERRRWRERMRTQPALLEEQP